MQALRTVENMKKVSAIIEQLRDKRRHGKYTLSYCITLLQAKWKRKNTLEPLTSQSIENYITDNVENPSFWLRLGTSGTKQNGTQLATVRERTCERFDQYLTVIGYQPAERQAIFTELAQCNPAVHYPDTLKHTLTERNL